MADDFVLGYALARNGGLPIVRTVSPSARAAMVNALVAEYGQMVWRTATDEEIKREFERCKPEGDEIVSVKIQRFHGWTNG